MKQKISATIDEELIRELEKHIKDRTFRNLSHAIEFCIYWFLKDKKQESEC